ncbi:MAG: hypothetical protein HS126_05135 [Anaerolineales bacterium]|nr:hypothetical protein [Anaerolineales bacterium]
MSNRRANKPSFRHTAGVRSSRQKHERAFTHRLAASPGRSALPIALGAVELIAEYSIIRPAANLFASEQALEQHRDRLENELSLASQMQASFLAACCRPCLVGSEPFNGSQPANWSAIFILTL